MGDNRKDAIPQVEYIVQRWFSGAWGDIGDGPCDFDLAVDVVCEAIEKDAAVMYQEDFRVTRIDWASTDLVTGIAPAVDITAQIFAVATDRLRGLEE